MPSRVLVGNGTGVLPLIPIEVLSKSLTNSFIEAGDLPGLEAALIEFGLVGEDDE